MSRRASRLGRPAGCTRPRNSLVDSRPDRMPPRAPELDRWAGTSTSRAGRASKRANDFSSVMPAPALTHPATSSTGHRLVHDAPQALGRRSPARRPGRRIDAATSSDADRRGDDRDSRAGTSPGTAPAASARRRGWTRAGRSRCRGPTRSGPRPPSGPGTRPAPRSTRAGRRRSTRSPSTAGRSSRRCRGPPPPPWPPPPGPCEMPMVSNMAASTFWPSTASRRSDQRKVPAWIEVEMRLPNEPKMLPRRPMAAGTRTSRPG